MNEQGNNCTIVVLEDDLDDLFLLDIELQSTHLINRMCYFEDGDELLFYLDHGGKFFDPLTTPHPRLVLLNRYIPKFDISEFISIIKNKPELDQIALVVMVASEIEMEELITSELDVSGYLIKPVTFSQLDTLIKKIDQT